MNKMLLIYFASHMPPLLPIEILEQTNRIIVRYTFIPHHNSL